MKSIQRGDTFAEIKYWGAYRAIVVDNNDPLRLGRLILQVPEIFGTALVTDWAFPKTGYLSSWDNTGEPNGTADGRDAYRRTPRFWPDRYDGGDKGDFLIPDVHDGVWCCFESGDACRPMWEGRYWTNAHGVPEPPRLSRSRGDETQTGDCSSSVALHFPDPWHKDDPSKKEIRTVCAYPKGTDSFITARLCGVPDLLFPDPFEQHYGVFEHKPLMKNYGEVIPEIPISYSAVYPNNRVLKTKRGIVVELDDTYDDANNVSHCRIHVWHPAKTWWEIHPDGSKTERIATRRYVCIEANDDKHVKGSWNVMVHGDATLHVNGDQYINVHGNRYVKIDGEDYLEVGGNQQNYVHGNRTQRVNMNQCEKVDLNRTVTIDKNDYETVNRSKFDFVQCAYHQVVACMDRLIQVLTGSHTTEVMGNISQSTMAAHMVNAVGPATRASSAMVVDLAPYIDHLPGAAVPPALPGAVCDDCTAPPCDCP